MHNSIILVVVVAAEVEVKVEGEEVIAAAAPVVLLLTLHFCQMVGLLQDVDGDEAHEFFVEDPKMLGSTQEKLYICSASCATMFLMMVHDNAIVMLLILSTVFRTYAA